MGATTDGEEMNSGSTEPERIKPTEETCEFEENNMSLPQDADCYTGIQDQKWADRTGVQPIFPMCNMPQRPTSNAPNTDDKEAEEQHSNGRVSALSASSQRTLPHTILTMDGTSKPMQGTLEVLHTDTPVDLEESVARPTAAEIMELLDKKNDDLDAMFETLHKEMQLADSDMIKEDLPISPDADLLDEEGYTSLYKAALKGHLERVDDLISQGANPDRPSKGGLTPLHAAAQEGHEDIVDYIILQGADVNVECEMGRTPLHMAAEKGHTKIMDSFLAEGTDVSKKDNTGQTPFLAAVHNGQLKAVNYLIAKGAMQSKFEGMTALYIAAQSGHLEIVKLLIPKGAYVNEENDSGQVPLHAAASRGHLDIINFLVDHWADVNKAAMSGWTPFHAAISNGHRDVVEYLTDNLALHTKFDEMTPLYIAARAGHLDIVKFLISQGHDANESNSSGHTPFHGATMRGHFEVTKYLIRHEADTAMGEGRIPFHATGINCQPYFAECISTENTETVKLNVGKTPFDIAVECGRLDIVTGCNSERKRVNEKNSKGEIPLHAAVRSGCIESTIFLILLGADVNKRDDRGNTPLIAAIQNGHVEIVKYLKTKGAQDTRVDGMTQLYVAAQSGHLDMVKFLISKGADVNEENDRGQVALHGAASRGHLEVMKCLVYHGADVNKETKSGWTAFHAAISNGHLDVVKYLSRNVACKKGFLEMSPLYIAAREGHLEVVKFLISKGHDVNEPNGSGHTPFQGAAVRNHVQVLEYFIRHEADTATGKGWKPSHAQRRNCQPYITVCMSTESIESVKLNPEKTPFDTAVECGRSDLVTGCISERTQVNEKNSAGEHPLHAAVRSGCIEITIFLILLGADVNKTDDRGTTPLLAAIQNGHVELVKYLKTKGAQDTRVDGMTQLYVAAQSGRLDMVKFLISKGADVNEENDTGQVPLHGAASRGHLEAIKFLVYHGADVNKETKSGWTPFHAAISNGHLDVVKYLKRNGACKTRFLEMSPLYIAARAGHLEVVKFLISQGADVNEENDSGQVPLHGAASQGHLHVIKYLHRYTSEVNKATGLTPSDAAVNSSQQDVVENLTSDGVLDTKFDRMTPLYIPTEFGHLDKVQFLFSQGADVNKENDSGQVPLHCAASRGHLDVINFLGTGHRSKMNKVTKSGWTPFHAAISKGHLNVVKYLTNNGAHYTGFDGMTPIYIAARAGHLGIVKFFISQGHDMNELNSSGNTPLQGAVVRDRLEVMEYLMRQGADIATGEAADEECFHTARSNSQPEVVENIYVEGTENQAKTPLYIAVECGRLDLVESLIKKGAHVNGTNRNGEIPLHAAARNGNLGITKYLICHGANLKKKDDVGTTPFLVALHSGHDEVVKYLKTKGAQDSRLHGMTPLYIAAQSGHFGIVKFLISHGADVNEENYSGQVPLHGAASGGHLEVVQYLVKHDAHVNKETVTGSTPFFRALSNGHLEVVKYLRTMSACMTRCQGMTPLYIAAQNGHSKVVNFIIGEGVDVNDGSISGKTPLHAASFTGNLDIVTTLVHEGAKVNAKDGDDWTPLHAAAQEGHTDVVTYLINSGADISATDADGLTPCLPPSNPGYPYLKEHSKSVGDGLVNTDLPRTIRNRICQDHGVRSINSISVRSEVTNSDEDRLSGSRMTVQLLHTLHLDDIACKHSQDISSYEDLVEIVISHEPAKSPEEEMNTIFTHKNNPSETGERMKRDHGHWSPFAKARFKCPVNKDQTSLLLETENSSHAELEDKLDTAATQHGPQNLKHYRVTTEIIEHQDDVRQSEQHQDDEDCAKSSKVVACEAVMSDEDHLSGSGIVTQLSSRHHHGECVAKHSKDTSYHAYLIKNENRYTVNIPERKISTVLIGHTTPPRTEERMKGNSSPSADEKPTYPVSKTKKSTSLGNKTSSHEKLDTQHDNTALLPASYKWQLNQIKGTVLHLTEKTAHQDVGRSGAGARIEEKREMKMPYSIKSGSNTGQPLEDDSTGYTSHSQRRIEPFLDRNCTKDCAPITGTIYAGSPQNEKKKRRRTGVRWSPLLVLLPSFIQMVVVMVFIITGISPVLVAGGLSTEPMILQAGQPAMIPFDIPRPPRNKSQVSPYFTLRFGSTPRPFCINGESDIEGFKSPSQFPRFTTSVAEMASSICVRVNIDPVDIVDEDMYVLQAFFYGFENLRQEIAIKEILVEIPPGPAKCFLTISENNKYPYEVHCHATTGSIPTTLTCYQYGERVEVEGDVTDNGLVTRGTFLPPDQSPFSCCSHDVTSEVNVTMCNDFEWPPSNKHISPPIVSDPSLAPSVANTVAWIGNTEQQSNTLVESQVDSGNCKPYTVSSVSLAIGLMIYLFLLY